MGLSRRELFALWGLGLAAALAGCGGQDAGNGAVTLPAGGPAPRRPHPHRFVAGDPQPPVPTPAAAPATEPAVAVAAAPTSASPFPAPRPGPPTVVSSALTPTQDIALTIDDGYDAETVSAYVDFAHRTGTPITFSPNGTYASVWEPHAAELRPLIARGQVQIGNHTFDHTNVTRVSDDRVRAELESNEAWIQRTFGVTSRPWFRPPYGARTPHSDDLAGDLGFTRILLWNGSFGDSRLLTPDVLLQQARLYLQPGTVMLGHANHPTVTYLFDSILSLIAERGLRPVTLDRMFGTSRARG